MPIPEPESEPWPSGAIHFAGYTADQPAIDGELMKSQSFRILVGALLVVSIAAGCSSPTPHSAAPAPGTLPSGTAKVVIDDKDSFSTHSVSCLPLGWLTIITIGDNRAEGVTAYVSNKDSLSAKSVSIRDLGGFTGSYLDGLGGNATVSMPDRTYDINGTARGFDATKSSATTTGNFEIKVSC